MHETVHGRNWQATSRIFLGLFCLIICSFGCGKREYEGEQRFAVSGTVAVDGQPLEPGYIGFFPQAKGEGAGRVSGGPVRDGKYSVPEPKGPNAGAYRVEIHWNKPTGKEIKDAYGDKIPQLVEGLPAKYHKNSELTAEVSPDMTTFNFELTSAK